MQGGSGTAGRAVRVPRRQGVWAWHVKMLPGQTSSRQSRGGSELEPAEERSERAGKKAAKAAAKKAVSAGKGIVAFIKRFWPVLLILAAFFAGYYIGHNGLPGSGSEDTSEEEDSSLQTVSHAAVVGQLDACAELVSAKMYYASLSDYSNKEIPIISKTSFTMYYECVVSAGIDLTDVQPVIDDEARTITVTLPAATIQSVDVDEGSLEFYKESTGIFSIGKQKEAVAEALELAEEDARTDIEELGLLDDAEENAVEIIEGFLSPFEEDVYGYEVIVTVEGSESDDADADEGSESDDADAEE